jgi:hydroxymethylglutaryl-CoA reductase
MDMKRISGFSKMSKLEKISWLAKNFLYSNPGDVINEFASFWHDNVEAQKQFDGFSENTLTNFHLPFGVAPNFLINGKEYCIPMVTEESSVVAAASNAAKFWMERGGIKATVLSTIKIGQVHFFYNGEKQILLTEFESIKALLLANIKPLTKSMDQRGGGVTKIELIDFTKEEKDYYQLKVSFETCDSMGANFINTVLEDLGKNLKIIIESSDKFPKSEIDINMCILSNYTPECIVKAEVSCPVSELGFINNLSSSHFADRFCKSVRIATIDSYRATTHNKGILNGIDAVVIATGNDFRAVEACIHTYAAHTGQYRSLSEAHIDNGIFYFSLTIPLALGTVGGLTKLHPLASKSLQLLGEPSAPELMCIVAAAGLAQNFSAVRSLVTTGIQQGHMKMHLNNIVAELNATFDEGLQIEKYFENKTISVSGVKEVLQKLRQGWTPNLSI